MLVSFCSYITSHLVVGVGQGMDQASLRTHRGSSPSHTHTHTHTHAWPPPTPTQYVPAAHTWHWQEQQVVSFCAKSGAIPLFCSLLRFHSLSPSFCLSARVPFPLQNITDIINVLKVECNFIARCLLRHDSVCLRILSMWKQSKVSYFRGSCIFYLMSSSPLWKEAEESKNTFALVCLLHAVHVSQAS